MGFAEDLHYAKRSVDIFAVVRRCQEGLGYDYGLVSVDGSDQKTRCPVHYDSAPSAKVYAGTNSVYCWVCGSSWDPPGLLAVSEGISVGKAVRILLADAGLHRTGAHGGVAALKAVLPSLTAAATPAPHQPAQGAVEAWVRGLYTWALTYVATYPVLDDLLDDIDTFSGLPPAQVLTSLRGSVAYCSRVSEILYESSLPPIPVEDAGFLSTLGLPV